MQMWVKNVEPMKHTVLSLIPVTINYNSELSITTEKGRVFCLFGWFVLCSFWWKIVSLNKQVCGQRWRTLLGPVCLWAGWTTRLVELKASLSSLHTIFTLAPINPFCPWRWYESSCHILQVPRHTSDAPNTAWVGFVMTILEVLLTGPLSAFMVFARWPPHPAVALKSLLALTTSRLLKDHCGI